MKIISIEIKIIIITIITIAIMKRKITIKNSNNFMKINNKSKNKKWIKIKIIRENIQTIIIMMIITIATKITTNNDQIRNK